MSKVSRKNIYFIHFCKSIKTALVSCLVFITSVIASDVEIDQASSFNNSPLTGRISPVEVIRENPDLEKLKLDELNEGLEELHSNRLWQARNRGIEFGDEQKFSLEDLDSLTALVNDDLRGRIAIANLDHCFPVDSLNWFAFQNLTNIQVLKLCNIMMNNEETVNAAVEEVYKDSIKVSTWVEWKRSVASQFILRVAQHTGLTPKQFEGDTIENEIHLIYMQILQIRVSIVNIPPCLVFSQVLPKSQINSNHSEQHGDCGNPYCSRRHNIPSTASIMMNQLGTKISKASNAAYNSLIEALFIGGKEYLEVERRTFDNINNDPRIRIVNGGDYSIQ